MQKTKLFDAHKGGEWELFSKISLLKMKKIWVPPSYFLKAPSTHYP